MTEKKPHIVVVGSFNMDLVITTERRPKPGETVIARSFDMFVGGKGFNQAVAAARQGADVRIIGRLGTDDFGQRILRNLETEGIDSHWVVQDSQTHTGVAVPVIDTNGENSILIVHGANNNLSINDIDKAADAIRAADILVAQLEVPLEAVQRAAQIAHEAGVPFLLNPAPARPLPDSLLRLVNILVPNETETEILSGIYPADTERAEKAARLLLAQGVGAVVLTLGARGAMLLTATETVFVPPFQVQVVDTTAAGDAFCGGLAVQLAQGVALAGAVRYASASGALATTVLGAEPAMPTHAAVLKLLG